MDRRRFLQTVAPTPALLLVAGCAATALQPARLQPLATPLRNPWKFTWVRQQTKISDTSYATARYQGSQVGELALDLKANRGGVYLADLNVWCVDPSGDKHSQTFDLFGLQAQWSKGAIVKLFESWYWQMSDTDPTAGTLYRNDGTLLGSGSSTQAPSGWQTTVTIEPVTVTFDWPHGGFGPDISAECWWALAAETAALVTLSGIVLGLPVSGPLAPADLLALAGAFANVLATMEAVQLACNK